MSKENSGKFIKDLDEFAGGKINDRIELQELVEIAAQYNRLSLFEELAFTAKYVQGLMKVLKSASSNPEITNVERIKTDLSVNVEKVFVQIREILTDTNEETIKRFEAKYLGMTGESFINLNRLMADLDWAKMYINHHKRSDTNQ